jgi:hypothetical protein
VAAVGEAVAVVAKAPDAADATATTKHAR